MSNLPPGWGPLVAEAFADLHRSYQLVLESEAIIKERKRRYLARLLRRAGTDRRLKTKTHDELSVLAFLENMRDSRTKEDIGEQQWMHQRVGTLAAYIDTVLKMHAAGLLPEEPPR